MLRVSSICTNERCVIHRRDSRLFTSFVVTVFVAKTDNLVRVQITNFPGFLRRDR